MDALFTFRDNIRRFYAKNSGIVRPVLKIVCAFSCFFILKLYLGDLAAGLFEPSFMLLFSLLCAFMPWGAITFFAGILTLFAMLETSFVMAGIMLMAMLCIGVLYFGFKPGHGAIIALVCVAFILKIPFAVPMVLGLYLGASAAIPCALGAFMWFMIRYFAENAGDMSRVMDTSVLLSDFSSVVDGFLKDRYMIIVMAAFVLCVLAVSVIKSLSINHAWTIAIACGGGILALLVMVVGAFFEETSLLWDIFGLVASFGIAFVYEFIFFAVDYSGAEKVQFEDDDYYYYVKAIPKIKSEEEDRWS
ncbi:MAG TPA: hypothetical protein IAB09_05710 [Candidatus Avilachnospira avicola]|nr:hypothetical protein [Candidatus Avilachnospira avicola]